MLKWVTEDSTSGTCLRCGADRCQLSAQMNSPHALRRDVIGIDDWAWRRNHRYGTIVCDLERRRPVALLPDREPATAAAWLDRHQEITVVARDRGGGYGEAVARALPQAVQVADRWHLMENASRAFLDAVRKTMRQIRTTIGATKINPELLTAAERLQYEGYQRRARAGEGQGADQRDRTSSRP
jgi:transposase